MGYYTKQAAGNAIDEETLRGMEEAVEGMRAFSNEAKKHVCSYCGLLHEAGDCVYLEGKIYPHFGAWPNPPRGVI